MADTTGQADIRDIFVSRLVKGFADEVLVFRSFVNTGNTSAREVRWVKKTAGFLSAVTTTGQTTDIGSNMTHLARPPVVRRTFTRNTSYVREFFQESPLISDEDIKDNMVGILAVHVRDVTRMVAKAVNDHIWNIMTENQSASDINSVTTTSVGGDQWDAASGQDPIKDINRAIRLIRTNNYEPTHLFLSPTDYESLVTWIISTKGSSIPQFASARVSDAVVTTFLGLNVVVSNSVTADYAAVAAPSQAVTYWQFTPLTSRTIDEPLIGMKVRVKEEGIATLTDPKAVTLIVDTQT